MKKGRRAPLHRDPPGSTHIRFSGCVVVPVCPCWSVHSTKVLPSRTKSPSSGGDRKSSETHRLRSLLLELGRLTSLLQVLSFSPCPPSLSKCVTLLLIDLFAGSSRHERLPTNVCGRRSDSVASGSSSPANRIKYRCA